MKWFIRTWIALLTALTMLASSRCMYTSEGGLFNIRGRQSALDPMGPVAQNQADIFYITLWVTLFLFVTVGGALAIATWRYRLRATDDPKVIPPQSHGHPLIEVGLVIASTALLVVIAVPTFGGIILKKQVPLELQADAIEINVTGYQWWWGFEYTEHGFHTANELVFPAGRAIKLNLRANDVIHSFWLPKLAGKVDLIPGQVNFIWIKADEPGYFWGQCAEYCGDSHAYMLFRARAVSEEEYATWLQRQQTATVSNDGKYMPVELDGAEVATIDHGRSLFIEHCVRCHSVDSRVQTMGPNLAHFGSRTSIAAGWMENEPALLAQWLLHPETIKPGNFMWYGFPDPLDPKGPPQMEGLKDANLTPQQAEALVAYLYTLK